MAAITVDESHWPLLMMKFDGDQTDAELEQHIRHIDAIYARKELFATITWMKKYARDKQKVERMGRWLKECEEVTRRYNVGSGLLSHSFGFRFVLSAVMLIRPIRIPYKVCSSFDEALTFVRAQAHQRGLLLPATVRPFSDWSEEAAVTTTG
jgi:hypothetical protein